MSKTFLKITRYESLQKAIRRLSHNQRKRSFDNNKMQNINEVLEDIKKSCSSPAISKTQITNTISKLNYRLKQYKKQEQTLTGYKQEKKLKQIEKLKDKIEDLKKQRANTQSQMKYAKKPFVEFVLTITDVPATYKKDINFAKELKRLFISFMESRFSNAVITNIDIHFDQANPHLYVMCRYNGNTSLQKDLDKSYFSIVICN